MMHRSNSGNLSGYYLLGVLIGGMLAQLHPGVFANLAVVIVMVTLPLLGATAVSRARDRQADELYRQNKRRRRKPSVYYVS